MQLTAEQVIPLLKAQTDLVTDPKEQQKIFNWILGVMESKEKRKARLHSLFEKKEKYQIKKLPANRELLTTKNPNV